MPHSLLRFALPALLLVSSTALAQLSDLVVEDVTPVTPVDGEPVVLTTVTPGTRVHLAFYIANRGTAPVASASVRLSLYVDAGTIPLERGFISMGGDPPGYKHGVIYSEVPWIAVAGVHSFRFVVDDTNLETESNEANNTLIFPITVVSSPGYRATPSPNPLTLTAGGASQAVTVTTSADAGFSAPITYSFSGFPAGVATGGSKAVTSPYAPIAFTFSAAQSTPAGSYDGLLQAVTSSGTQTVPMRVVVQAGGGASGDQVVPIVLDVTTAIAHFTTELTLTNRGTSPVNLALTYTGALEGAGGSGSTTDTIPAGTQTVIPNAITYLRGRGVGSGAPEPLAEPNAGGTLRVQFSGASSADAVAVSARTTTATAAPQPVGAAGLAYAAIASTGGLTGRAVVYGLRSNADDRSNLAVFNPSASEVTVKVTAFSGGGDGASVVVRQAETLAPLAWLQYSGILAEAGLTNGWVVVEKVGGAGSFGTYGVINDNQTSDGSFVLPVVAQGAQSKLIVPVLVETATFRSELILANRGTSPVTLQLAYRESLSPTLGAGGTVAVELAAGEQRIIPEAIAFLRGRGAAIGAADAASYAGALRVEASGGAPLEVFAGARTAARSPAGGQFGLFTPGVFSGSEASQQAFLYGLRADSANRANVAVLNAGDAAAGSVTLELRAYDGSAGGVEKGGAVQLPLAPGEWRQLSGFLATQGVSNGWVRITRVAGTAPWIAYGVLNDGGAPGERTGDGAYVPMSLP